MSEEIHMRLTKIVCTLGPASDTEELIRSLAEGGMDVARMNLSHGTRKQQTKVLTALKEIQAGGRGIGILFDTRGAAIRTGDVTRRIAVAAGEEVIFSPGKNKNTGKVIRVNHDGFAKDARKTDRILIDNGLLTFDIISIHPNGTVTAKAKEGGSIGSRRHVNLPGADIDLPALAEEDWQDLLFGIEQEIDYIALSFVRTADDVESVRTYLKKHRGSDIRIIAKIETARGVKNIAEIIDASDGIMVARGDLGSEVPFEKLPAIQDEIVSRCIDAGKFVIVATQMMESMVENSTPTRAEVMDVAHAAETKADATMLSGETATGKFPLEAVRAMAKVLQETEDRVARLAQSATPVRDGNEARGEAAAALAQAEGAVAIVAFSYGGETARLVSRCRPEIPIVTFTPTANLQRKLALLYGVRPSVLSFAKPEATIAAGMQILEQNGLVKKGDKVILVSDAKAKNTPVGTVRVHTVI